MMGMMELSLGERAYMDGFCLEGTNMHPHFTIPMILHCPMCNGRHIDTGEFEFKAHHTHACQQCGHVWRPAKVNTHGVQFLPGFKNKEPEELSIGGIGDFSLNDLVFQATLTSIPPALAEIVLGSTTLAAWPEDPLSSLVWPVVNDAPFELADQPEIPPPPPDTLGALLWHVEQVMGPISREACEVEGDDDYSILRGTFQHELNKLIGGAA